MEDVKNKESSEAMCYVYNVLGASKFGDAVCEVEVPRPAEDSAAAIRKGAV